MESIHFTCSENTKEMATEIICLKSMIALMLRALGQADGSKVILTMEKLVNSHENDSERKIFQRVIQEMRLAYRQ